VIEKAVKKFPNVKAVATTLREVHSTNRHTWGAVAWINGQTYQSPTCELDVVDRVGGGDGYAAGFIYGLLNGLSGDEAVNLGWAHGALLTTFPGDTTMATVEAGEGFRQGRLRPHSTREQIHEMYPTVPAGLFRVHNWRTGITTVGTVPGEFVREVSEGAVDFPWPAQVANLIAGGGP
jgi:hypothetical protein